ncbi:MAG: RCC1 repeat-containing protein, partial [Myxococcales bacterium]|nr:RCC1 repeat-containing protein [Myxococcales bacterium]MBL8719181.1 RCC1 repeat-containing protein [Myxococcales bacterium]
AGDAHTCARLHDATVTCWGASDYGQVGDGERKNRLEPVKVEGLGHVQQLALGWSHTCVLRDDATVWCWGANSKGQLGNGATKLETRPTPILVLPDP